MEAERAELAARLEVTQMSLEAAKKEQQILSIAVHQKEAEITRHEDISRYTTTLDLLICAKSLNFVYFG